MTTKKTVDFYISELEKEKRNIAEALRKIILNADAELQETVKWGNRTYEKNGKVCYIADMSRHINFGFFKGAHLTDTTGRVEGTGKAMRHIKIKSLDDILPEQFSSWVKDAVALNEQP